MKKQTLTLILALTVAASMLFAGCGGQTNETKESASVSETTPEATPEATKEATKAPTPEPTKEVTEEPEEEKTGVIIEDEVITDENGVSITDMAISINTPETASFDFTTNNPEGTDVTFDQTRIELEKEDGTKLDPFADNSEPIDASAQVERHFFEMDAANIGNGDVILVYFDGEPVTALVVTGGMKSGSSSAVKPAGETAEEPAEEENASNSGTEDSWFLGNWQFYAQESEDPNSSITHEQVEEAKEQGFDYSTMQLMAFYEDGTYVINMMGDISEGGWTDNGDGTGTIMVEGGDWKIEKDGDLLKAYAAENTSWFERSEYSPV